MDALLELLDGRYGQAVIDARIAALRPVAYTDAERAKLASVEHGATDDQTATEIVAAVGSLTGEQRLSYNSLKDRIGDSDIDLRVSPWARAVNPSGVAPAARLGYGQANRYVFLRGDGYWQAPNVFPERWQTGGTWNAYDFVRHNNAIYRARSYVAGTTDYPNPEPGVGTGWADVWTLTFSGAGVTVGDGVFPEAWSRTEAYVDGNMVHHSNRIYQARMDSTGVEPGEHADWEDSWRLVFEPTANSNALLPFVSEWAHVLNTDLIPTWKLDIPPANLTRTLYGAAVGIESSTGSDAVIPSASRTEAGVMAAADKAKLDGIEAGATVSRPAYPDPWDSAVTYRQDDYVTNRHGVYRYHHDLPGSIVEPGNPQHPWRERWREVYAPRTAGEIVGLIEGLSGDARLQYSAIRGTPAIPDTSGFIGFDDVHRWARAGDSTQIVPSKLPLATNVDRGAISPHYLQLLGTMEEYSTADQTPAEIRDALISLAGDHRLPYRAIWGTPDLSSFVVQADIDQTITDDVELWARRLGSASIIPRAKLPVVSRSYSGLMGAPDKVRLDELDHRGEWTAGVTYQQDNWVTHRGGLYQVDSPGGFASTEPGVSVGWANEWRRFDAPVSLGSRRDSESVTVFVEHGGSLGEAAIPFATPQLAGVMTGAEKFKLQSIENYATADQTGSEMVALIAALQGNLRLPYTALRDTPDVGVQWVDAEWSSGRIVHQAGEYYIAREDVEAGDPAPNASSNEKWRRITVDGVFPDAWINSITYRVGDRVRHDNQIWECIRLHLWNEPGVSPVWGDYWKRIHNGRIPTNLSWARLDANTLRVVSSTGSDTDLPTATVDYAGTMSATDKVRLDAIEDEATADQTGAEMVAALSALLGADRLPYSAIEDTPTIPTAPAGWAETADETPIPAAKLINAPVGDGLNAAAVDARIASWARFYSPHGTAPVARLGTGAADSTKFLRGDGTWAMVPGGSSGLSQGEVDARIVALRPVAYSQAEQTKLGTIEAGATADQTAAEMVAALSGLSGSARLSYTSLKDTPASTGGGGGLSEAQALALISDWAEEGNDDAIPANKLTNAPGLNQAAVDARINSLRPIAYTQSERTKLGGMEAGATADQTPAEMVAALEGLAGNSRLQYSALRNAPLGFPLPWSRTTAYSASDVVRHNNVVYQAIADNVGYEPGTTSGWTTRWSAIFDGTVGPAQSGLTQAQVDARITALRPNPFTDSDEAKLDGIEAGATADQTGAEMATALSALSGTSRLPYAALRDTPAIPDVSGLLNQTQVDARINSLRPVAYTQTEKTKLSGIEAGATADQTGTEMAAALEALTGSDRLQYSALRDIPTIPDVSGFLSQGQVDARITALRPNPFTDSDEAKLDGIEASATADQTGGEIVALLAGLGGADRLSYNSLKDTPASSGSGDGLTESAVLALIFDWAENGNDDPIPASKLTNAPGGLDQAAVDLRIATLRPLAYTQTERSKLSGIEAGATADQTAAEMVAALEGLTGTGKLSYAALQGVPSIPDVSGFLSQTQVDARINSLRPLAYTQTERSKLSGIETGATADQTAAEMVAALEGLAGSARLQYSAIRGVPSIPDVSGFLSQAEVDARVTALRPLAYSSAERTKLAGIETGATADQTGAEMVTALSGLSGAARLGYGSIKDTPAIPDVSGFLSQAQVDARVTTLRPVAYTQTEKTKLAGIESGATADQTAVEMVAALEGLSGNSRLQYSAIRGVPSIPDVSGFLSQAQVDARVTTLRPVAYTQTEKTKLAGIEAGATGDQTGTEIVALLTGLSGNARLGYGALTNRPAIPPAFPVSWAVGTTYRAGAHVRHGNVVYEAAADSTGVEPGETSGWQSSWTALFDGNVGPAQSGITSQQAEMLIATWARANNPTGTAPVARLGTGTADSTRFLRGDGIWADSLGGGGAYKRPETLLYGYFTVDYSGDYIEPSGTLPNGNDAITIPTSGRVRIYVHHEAASGEVVVAAQGLRDATRNSSVGRIYCDGGSNQFFEFYTDDDGKLLWWSAATASNAVVVVEHMDDGFLTPTADDRWQFRFDSAYDDPDT